MLYQCKHYYAINITIVPVIKVNKIDLLQIVNGYLHFKHGRIYHIFIICDQR